MKDNDRCSPHSFLISFRFKDILHITFAQSMTVDATLFMI